ncbi:MAG: 2-C-methyl-D-erythritol 4-phosphate cytidylyltransferase [Nitrospirae bacterium]|nr:2-C-methyl-D-erythritol 4-phosphate cytidylyltransferase [Nitrospirota bacterium]
MKVTAIIPAAGKGKRMVHTVPKHFIRIENKPVLAHTLDVFEKCPEVHQVLVISRSGEEDYCLKEVVEKYGYKKVLKIVIGGDRRQDSVYSGIKELDEDTDIVVVHDGVRPFVSPGTLSEAVKLAMFADGVVTAVPVRDTIKDVGEDGIIRSTPDRSTLWNAQTPQVFKRRILEEAYLRAYNDKFSGTDESSLVERLGYRVKIMEGTPENIKITTKEDLLFAEVILMIQKKKSIK